MTTTEIVTNWELSLSDYQHEKLVRSKLDVIQCYSIDKQEKQDNLHEQAWNIETYKELFYDDNNSNHYEYDRAIDYDYHF